MTLFNEYDHEFKQHISVQVVVVVVGFKVDFLTGDLDLWLACPPGGSF